MASLNDFYNAVKEANTHLAAIDADEKDLHGDAVAIQDRIGLVKQAVTTLAGSVISGFKTMAELEAYADNALAHLAKQNETIICLLDKIAQSTCGLLNQGDLEVRALTAINVSGSALQEMYADSHPRAALSREHQQAVQKQILDCCPPDPIPPVCTYESCPVPPALGDPPVIGQPSKPR